MLLDFGRAFRFSHNGTLLTQRVCSTVGDIMMHVGRVQYGGDIMNTLGDTKYRGGYHDARGGYHQYRGGYHSL